MSRLATTMKDISQMVSAREWGLCIGSMVSKFLVMMMMTSPFLFVPYVIPLDEFVREYQAHGVCTVTEPSGFTFTGRFLIRSLSITHLPSTVDFRTML